MNRCKTCDWYRTTGTKTCVCPKMFYGYEIRTRDSDGVKIEDDEGWGMIPGPNFGCIHHVTTETVE